MNRLYFAILGGTSVRACARGALSRPHPFGDKASLDGGLHEQHERQVEDEARERAGLPRSPASPVEDRQLHPQPEAQQGRNLHPSVRVLGVVPPAKASAAEGNARHRPQAGVIPVTDLVEGEIVNRDACLAQAHGEIGVLGSGEGFIEQAHPLEHFPAEARGAGCFQPMIGVIFSSTRSNRHMFRWPENSHPLARRRLALASWYAWCARLMKSSPAATTLKRTTCASG